jgi:hypothetical protein
VTSPAVASRVVYIVGWGRSGSTLLTAILGELRGAFAAGELRWLWSRGVISRKLCGCGVPIPECPVWSQVLERLKDAPSDADEMAHVQATRLRSRHFLPELIKMARNGGPDDQLARYAETYVRALAAVSDVTGAEVIIDSSKNPIDALLLERAGVELWAVNLVRDPRAVAASWGRRKRLDDGDDEELRRFSPWSSSVLWTLWNALGFLVGRKSHRRREVVRFESFLADPEAEIDRLVEVCGLSRDGLQLEGRCVHLSPNHLVAGNGDRFTTGAVRINPEDTATLDRPADTLLSSLAALPLTRRYGYRAFGKRRNDDTQADPPARG